MVEYGYTGKLPRPEPGQILALLKYVKHENIVMVSMAELQRRCLECSEQVFNGR